MSDKAVSVYGNRRVCHSSVFGSAIRISATIHFSQCQTHHKTREFDFFRFIFTIQKLSKMDILKEFHQVSIFFSVVVSIISLVWTRKNWAFNSIELNWSKTCVTTYSIWSLKSIWLATNLCANIVSVKFDWNL